VEEKFVIVIGSSSA